MTTRTMTTGETMMTISCNRNCNCNSTEADVRTNNWCSKAETRRNSSWGVLQRQMVVAVAELKAYLQTLENRTPEAVLDQLDQRRRSEVYHIALCCSDLPIHVVQLKPAEIESLMMLLQK